MSMFTDPNHLRVEDLGTVEGNPYSRISMRSQKLSISRGSCPNTRIRRDESSLSSRRAWRRQVKRFLINVLEDMLVRFASAANIGNLDSLKSSNTSRNRQRSQRRKQSHRQARPRRHGINYFEDDSFLKEAIELSKTNNRTFFLQKL